MIAKLLNFFARAGLGTGSIVGVIIVRDPTVTNKFEKKNIFKTKTTPAISNLDDIEIMEGIYGCSLGFVGSWKENKSYRANEFFSSLTAEQKKEKSDWKEVMVKAGNSFSARCIKGDAIALAYNKEDNVFYLHDDIK